MTAATSNIFVPILMYHRVTTEDPSGFATTPDRFEAQIAFLHRRGYQSVGLDEVTRQPAPGAPSTSPTPKQICLTFDDGYEDTYATAWPILRKYGFTATIFVVTARVGTVNAWDRSEIAPPARLMSWTQLREMRANGFPIESHGCTHANLPGLPPARLEYEVSESRKMLEQELGAPANYFAYPYCEADIAAIEAVRRAGYRGAVGGLVADDQPFLLGRIEAARDQWMPLAVELSPAYRRLRSNPLVRWAGRPLRARRRQGAAAPKPVDGVVPITIQ